MRIIVTGGEGFIGRNLRVRLAETANHDVASVGRNTPPAELNQLLESADFVFHLAGVNRPPQPADFDAGNRGFTATLCERLRATGRPIPIAYTSSTQARLDNPYGVSKRAAEEEVERYAADSGAAHYIYRLPNVFGKWSRPNYNSAVATFCHNIARGQPITVHDAAAPVRLVYIDDVVESMLGLLGSQAPASGSVEVEPVYDVTVGEIADLLRDFAASRTTRRMPPVGTGFTRALYATYLSFLPPETFAYGLTRHSDPRGAFAEILQTPNCGQFSFFTAFPGVTRGGHYHHTKNEKFVVVKGQARFRFRHLVTDEVREIDVAGPEARVVETVPGWVHDITNVGDDELIVLLWANEIFDPNRPDTVAAPLTATTPGR